MSSRALANDRSRDQVETSRIKGMTRPGSPASRDIVVAVDNSASSAAAVRWAAAEASRRGARLRAVHVVEPCPPEATSPEIDPDHDLRLQLDLARRSIPGRVGGWIFGAGIDVDVAVVVVTGDVTAQIAHEAQDAALVVIGAPDALRHRDLPDELASACRCRVVMVAAGEDVTFVNVPGRPRPASTRHHQRTDVVRAFAPGEFHARPTAEQAPV
jgi:nucleotide-binding universal stress UspA family protein